MKYLILLGALFIGDGLLSQTKYVYTLAIIDSNKSIESNAPIVVIYNSDTIDTLTNNEGQVSLNIKYSFPCSTGMLHGLFSKRQKNRRPTFGTGEIAIICKGRPGSFVKNWNDYFAFPEQVKNDLYMYDRNILLSNNDEPKAN